MESNLEINICQIERGKELFNHLLDAESLELDDSFLLVLTDSEECIRYGIKYLSDFINLYHKKNVYIFLNDFSYAELFNSAGGKVVHCEMAEMYCLAEYLNIFRDKEFSDTRIIFLTEKDGYGIYIEELLRRKEFSLEEYVAVSLYQLKRLRKEIAFDRNKRNNLYKDRGTLCSKGIGE